jgi:hypothetical protein
MSTIQRLCMLLNSTFVPRGSQSPNRPFTLCASDQGTYNSFKDKVSPIIVAWKKSDQMLKHHLGMKLPFYYSTSLQCHSFLFFTHVLLCTSLLYPHVYLELLESLLNKSVSRQQKQRPLYDTVLHATSCHRNMVSFGAMTTPVVVEVASNSLRVKHVAAVLPKDLPIPSLASIPL